MDKTHYSIYKNYQVNKANIVGHSMGGVSGLRYLGTYGQDTSLPKIEKFVSIEHLSMILLIRVNSKPSKRN